MHKNNYIPQIDGLRAVAVLSVILYHANFKIFGINFFDGGYFGVDIFFVISGYLITKLIISEIKEKNKFNFKNFYLRRVRRIIPALLTVALITYPLAYFFFLPIPFLEYIGSLISGIFFSSNLFFYFSEIEYGATPSLYKPLLHYWSLSVEEQFYFLYPISLYLIYKFFKNNLILVFTIIGFLSFFLSNWLNIHNNNSLSFYLFPTRVWEFLVGAFLAKLHYQNQNLGIINHNSKSRLQWAGIFLIIFSIIFLSEFNIHKLTEMGVGIELDGIIHKLFLSNPGFMTLIPITGTFLVILFVGEKNLLNKILSFGPIVFIGLISYSLYLWHLPIFSFVRISTIDINTLTEFLLLVTAIFVLSILSFYLIEKPFRNKKITSIKTLFLFIISIITILLLLSFHAYKNNAYSSIIPDYFKEFQISKSGEILLKKDNTNTQLDNLNSNNELYSKTFLLIGDSHAEDIKEILKDELSKKRIGLDYLHYSNIFSLDLTNVETNGGHIFLNENLNIILKNKDISTIILMSRFPWYMNQSGFNAQQGADGNELTTKVPYFLNFDKERLNNENRKEIIIKSFNESILKILNKDINIIIIYPIPEVGFLVPNVLAAKLLPRLKLKLIFSSFFQNPFFFDLPQSEYVKISYHLYLQRNKEVFKMLDQTQHPNLHRTYPHKKFCDSQIKNMCITHTHNEIYYKDNNHLSKEGVKLIMPELFEVFNWIK